MPFLPRARWAALTGVAAASAAYIYLGILPQNPGMLNGVPDYFIHTGAYGLLTILGAMAAEGLSLRRPALLGAAYAVAHGALLEVVQYFNPPRTAEWHDLASDAVGAMLAAVLWTGARGWLRRRDRSGAGGLERRPSGRDGAGPLA